jgi:drug/metabolite transporter (DMT)-like permease
MTSLWKEFLGHRTSSAMFFRMRTVATFAIVGAVWGSAWIPAATLSQALPGLIAGALRFGLAAVLLGMTAGLLRWRTPAELRRPIARLLGPSAMLGVTMLGLPYALTVWGSERVSAGVVALCFGLMPIVILLADDEGREGAIPAVVLGIGGVAMVVASGISFRWQQAGGVAALLAAVGLSAFSYLYVRRLFARDGVRGEEILSFSAIQLGVAAVLLAALFAGAGLGVPTHWQKTAALPLALLAIVVSGGTLPLLYWLLSRVTAWQVATLEWVATLVAVAEAAWVVGARPAAESWIGAALIPACIFWIFLNFPAGSGGAVTLEITKHTFQAAKASDDLGDSR